MTREDELIKAAQTIKNECEKTNACSKCFFSLKDENGLFYCSVSKDEAYIPQDWNVLGLMQYKAL